MIPEIIPSFHSLMRDGFYKTFTYSPIGFSRSRRSSSSRFPFGIMSRRFPFLFFYTRNMPFLISFCGYCKDKVLTRIGLISIAYIAELNDLLSKIGIHIRI